MAQQSMPACFLRPWFMEIFHEKALADPVPCHAPLAER
jgi:hypothetical protein